jgi:hypothetical protein
VLDAVLDPIGGTILQRGLAAIDQELFRADWAAAKEAYGEDARPDRLARTGAQRRADALVELARRAEAGVAGARMAVPLFTVLVDYPSFGRVLELADGTPITPGQAAAWVAVRPIDVERVVFDGASRVIDLAARTRFFVRGVRRALQVRDRGCTFPGCDTPAERCEADHEIPWEAGGRTDHANGRLRCPFHHRHRHRTRGDKTRPPRRGPNGPRPPP